MIDRRLNFIDASQALRELIPEIVSSAARRFKREIAAAEDESLPTLEDDIGEYLESLAEQIHFEKGSKASKNAEDKSQELSAAHGLERLSHSTYCLVDLIQEHRILSAVVLEVLERKGALPIEVRVLIIERLGLNLERSVAKFSDTLRKLQQRMIGTLAHDIRGTLNQVRMGAELLKKCPEDKALIQKTVERFQRSVNHANAMITDLLDANVLELGNALRFDFEPVDLERVAREAVEEAKETFGRRVELSTKTAPAGNWNAIALRRIFDNLIENALKYGSLETPVSVSLDSDDSNAFFTVHNFGHAIPSTMVSSMFEAYRRGEPKGKGRGWGLGLSVVSGLVAAHRGSINVESTDEKGTTFTIILPLNTAVSASEGNANLPPR